MIDGKKKDSAMTVPPVMINVRRLILSAIAIKSSDPKTRITPWIIGHIKAELAALPAGCSRNWRWHPGTAGRWPPQPQQLPGSGTSC